MKLSQKHCIIHNEVVQQIWIRALCIMTLSSFEGMIPLGYGLLCLEQHLPMMQTAHAMVSTFIKVVALVLPGQFFYMYEKESQANHYGFMSNVGYLEDLMYNGISVHDSSIIGDS